MNVMQRTSVFPRLFGATCIFLVALFVIPSLGQSTSSSCPTGCNIRATDRAPLLFRFNMNAGVVKDTASSSANSPSSNLGDGTGNRVFYTSAVASASNTLPRDGVIPCTLDTIPTVTLSFPGSQLHSLQLGEVSCSSTGSEYTLTPSIFPRPSFCSIQFIGLADVASTMRVEIDFQDGSTFSSFQTMTFTMRVPGSNCAGDSNCTSTGSWATGNPTSTSVTSSSSIYVLRADLSRFNCRGQPCSTRPLNEIRLSSLGPTRPCSSSLQSQITLFAVEGIISTPSSSDLGGGAIAGIVLGSLAFVFIVTLICCRCCRCCCFKQKNQSAYSYPSTASISSPAYATTTNSAVYYPSTTPSYLQQPAAALAESLSSSDGAGAGVPGWVQKNAATVSDSTSSSSSSASSSSSSSSSSLPVKAATTQTAKKLSAMKMKRTANKAVASSSSESSSSSDDDSGPANASAGAAPKPAFLTTNAGSTSSNQGLSTLKSLIIDDSSEEERKEMVQVDVNVKKSASPSTLKSMYMDESSGEEQREDIVERQRTTVKAPSALRAMTNDDSSEEERRVGDGEIAGPRAKPVYSFKYSAKDYEVGGRKNTKADLEKQEEKIDETKDPALKEIKFCMNCASESMNSVLKPCGHSVLCFGCAMELMSNLSPKCPYCNQKVQSTGSK